MDDRTVWDEENPDPEFERGDGDSRRLLISAGAVAVLVLLVFAIFEGRLPESIVEPEGWLNTSTSAPIAAFLVVLLLAADVILPIPSSTLMIACGVAFGFIFGALVAAIGSTLAGVVGLLIGRFMPGRRIVAPVRGESLAQRAVDRWGAAAIVATRPIPILAETTAIVLGRTNLSIRRMVFASAVGSLAPAIAYSWLGARARTSTSIALVLGILVTASVLAAIVGSFVGRSSDNEMTSVFGSGRS